MAHRSARLAFTALLVSLPLATASEGRAQDVAPQTRRIELRADREDAELQRRSGGIWVTLCKAPCAQSVPSGTYRIAGDGVIASDDFVIPAGEDPFVLRAETGSSAKRTIGIVMIPVGAIAFCSGLLLRDMAHGFGDQGGTNGSGGAALVALGAILVGGGIAFAAFERTSVTTSPPRAASAFSYDFGRGISLTPSGLHF
jgi:hypothetical protein